MCFRRVRSCAPGKKKDFPVAYRCPDLRYDHPRCARVRRLFRVDGHNPTQQRRKRELIVHHQAVHPGSSFAGNPLPEEIIPLAAGEVSPLDAPRAWEALLSGSRSSGDAARDGGEGGLLDGVVEGI